jgi:hypothetical protein
VNEKDLTLMSVSTLLPSIKKANLFAIEHLIDAFYHFKYIFDVIYVTNCFLFIFKAFSTQTKSLLFLPNTNTLKSWKPSLQLSKITSKQSLIKTLCHLESIWLHYPEISCPNWKWVWERSETRSCCNGIKRLTEELDFRLNHKINKVIKNIGEITVRSALTDYTLPFQKRS